MLHKSSIMGLNVSHLGCFWRFEVRMYMLVLHRPRVGNVQKTPDMLVRDVMW